MTIPKITERFCIILIQLDNTVMGYVCTIMVDIDPARERDAWKDRYCEIVISFIGFWDCAITVDASSYPLGFFLEFEKEISA